MTTGYMESHFKKQLANKYLLKEISVFTEKCEEAIWAFIGFSMLVATIAYFGSHAVVAIAERNI